MLEQMKCHILKFKKQHQDILRFVSVVVIFHIFWKIGREADATDQIIHFYGKDFTPFFAYICDLWVNLIYHIVHFLKGDVVFLNDCKVSFSDTETSLRIVWGCCGIKELIMVALVIVTARGAYRKKLWYIPIGIAFMLLLNIIRLTTLTLLIHHHTEMFDFVHSIIFRTVMYGGLFAVWLVWIEKVGMLEASNISKVDE